MSGGSGETFRRVGAPESDAEKQSARSPAHYTHRHTGQTGFCVIWSKHRNVFICRQVSTDAIRGRPFPPLGRSAGGADGKATAWASKWRDLRYLQPRPLVAFRVHQTM